jgi:hypothetical protein
MLGEHSELLQNIESDRLRAQAERHVIHLKIKSNVSERFERLNDSVVKRYRNPRRSKFLAYRTDAQVAGKRGEGRLSSPE